MPNLILVDPTFSPVGHYRNLAQTLQRTAHKLGVGFQALVPRNAVLAGFEPASEIRTVLPPRRSPAPRKERLSQFFALCRALSQAPLPDSATLFWPAPEPEDLVASLLLPLRFGSRLRQVVVPHFHCRRGYRSPGVVALRLAQLLSRAGLPWHGWAASRRFQQEYEQIGVGSLPVIPEILINPVEVAEPRTSGPCRLAFLGHARAAKGFPLLVDTLYRLREELERGEVVFSVQVTGAEDDEPRTRQALLQLQTEPLPGVTLLSGYLSQEEYRCVLEASDYLLLPYDPAHYAFYPSAAQQEALAAGRPTIVTRGTLAAEIVLRSGCGLVCDFGSADVLRDTIRQAVENRTRLTRHTWEQRHHYRERHSPEAFFASVLFGK